VHGPRDIAPDTIGMKAVIKKKSRQTLSIFLISESVAALYFDRTGKPRDQSAYRIPVSQFTIVSVYALAFTLIVSLLEQKGRMLDAAAERMAYSPGST